MDSLLSPRRRKPGVSTQQQQQQRRKPPARKPVGGKTTQDVKTARTTVTKEQVAKGTVARTTVIKAIENPAKEQQQHTRTLTKPKPVLLRQTPKSPEPTKDVFLALDVLEVLKKNLSKLNEEKDVDKVNMFKVYEKMIEQVLDVVKVEGNNIKEKKNEVKEGLKTYHGKYGKLESNAKSNTSSNTTSNTMSNAPLVVKEHSFIKFMKQKSRNDDLDSPEVSVQTADINAQTPESRPNIEIGEIQQRLSKVIDNFRSSLSHQHHEGSSTRGEEEKPKKERRKSFTDKFNLSILTKLTHHEAKEQNKKEEEQNKKQEEQNKKEEDQNKKGQKREVESSGVHRSTFFDQEATEVDAIQVDTTESVVVTEANQSEVQKQTTSEEEEIKIQKELEYYKTLGGKLSALIGDFKESYVKSLHKDKKPTGTDKKPSNHVIRLNDIKTNLLQITTCTEEEFKHKKFSKLLKECNSKFEKIPLNEQTAYLKLEVEQILEQAKTRLEAQKTSFHAYASSVDTNSTSSISESTPDLAGASSMDHLAEDPEEVKKKLARLKIDLEYIVKKIEASNILNDGMFLQNLNRYQDQLGDLPSVLSPDIVETRRQVFDLLMQAYDLLDDKH